jgi:demethylmenaquinone methyltransferase / 2-methoxy-6-polyprenyl-1,4-benzoquinol methylase
VFGYAATLPGTAKVMPGMSEQDNHIGLVRKPERPLKRMFDAVPKRYDRLNRLLTLRLDERWRRRAARRCLENNPARVLDLCCGTGDLALHLARLAAGQVEIVGLDYSADMLELACKKAALSDSGQTVRFIEGDAASMEFDDGYFDSVGIAFGFRNLTWHNPLRDQALAEVRRVLRPGGTFVIVETSQPRNRVWRAGFHTYLSAAVRPMGGWISGRKAAYKYLAESAKNFYDAQEVCTLLSKAGFEKAQVKILMGGVAAIHVTTRR